MTDLPTSAGAPCLPRPSKDAHLDHGIAGSSNGSPHIPDEPQPSDAFRGLRFSGQRSTAR
jgi:hypothetical protein